jgi:hypothetical protein
LDESKKSFQFFRLSTVQDVVLEVQLEVQVPHLDSTKIENMIHPKKLKRFF